MIRFLGATGIQNLYLSKPPLIFTASNYNSIINKLLRWINNISEEHTPEVAGEEKDRSFVPSISPVDTKHQDLMAEIRCFSGFNVLGLATAAEAAHVLASDAGAAVNFPGN